MLCTNCGKNQATVHITKNVNGMTREYYLCPECAKQMDIQNPFDSFASLFKSMFPFAVGEGLRQAKKCPTCGSTLDEITKSGMLGCAGCYDAFEQELKPMIANLHANSTYVPDGEAKQPQPEKKNVNETDELKNRLRKAVEEEDYELAAKLRDEIKAKEAKGNE